MSKQSIEKIPSDRVVTMSSFWHKAFNSAGCDPECHLCDNPIKVNHKFKLATVIKTPSLWKPEEAKRAIELIKGEIDSYPSYNEEDTVSESHEVMLCENCTVEAYQEAQIQNLKNRAERMRSGRGGCFRVNGKIVTSLS